MGGGRPVAGAFLCLRFDVVASWKVRLAMPRAFTALARGASHARWQRTVRGRLHALSFQVSAIILEQCKARQRRC